MLVQAAIARSMRLIRVLDPGEAPEAADYETCIEAANGMMTRMEANGTSLGWSNVVSPGDVLPLPAEAEEPFVYMLALRIAPEYGVAADPIVAAGASAGEAALLRDVLVASPIYNESTGPCPNMRGRWYDIYSDSAR